MNRLADVFKLIPAACGCGSEKSLYKDPGTGAVICKACLSAITTLKCGLCKCDDSKEELLVCEDGSVYHHSCASQEICERQESNLELIMERNRA